MEKEPKPEWLERVLETKRFHAEHLKDDKNWTIKQTAILLRRGIGPVSEELKVASWLRTHREELLQFEFIHEAIEFIRSKKHHHLIEE